MKKRVLLSTIALMFLTILWSCKTGDSLKPAPQISSPKASFNLVPDVSDSVTITIVSPGKFSSVTATADDGTVTVSNVTGTGSDQGSADLKYTAPDNIGDYTITITATDQSNQTGTLTITVSVTAKPPVDVPAGEVSGIWEKNTTYVAGGTLIIPQGQSLTIQEGVTVIFDGDGSQGAPELSVQGSLYSYGTEDKPVLFSIPEAKRVKDNIFAGLWGGLQATQDAEEMVLEYTNIDYVGAPTGGTNPSVNIGPYDDGDPRYAVLFSNPNGKFVMQHCRIAYTTDDGMRVVGGTILVSDNMFILNGKNGGESINIKSSVTGTVAYNVSYRAATNAYKWSNASGSAATPQTDIFAYNNTSVESGWRQTKTGRGGSINVEAGGRGMAVNNLIVNARFGTKIVDDADVTNLIVGYNQYYGTDTVMVNQFYPTAVSFLQGDSETANDIAGGPGENDPMFVNYDVSTYTSDFPVDPLTLDYMPEDADFHLQSGAPGLTAGLTSFTVKPSISINGQTYDAPAPSAFIGALGTN